MHQKLHDADFDPSTSDLYVMMHALDSSTDKNILITEQLCSYAVRDNLQIKVMERVEDNFK